MKTTRFVGILLVILFVMAPCISADAQETIGVVRNTTGEATITRGDQVLPAVPGMKLIAGDTLGTGSDGTLGVILRDNSTLSLGPGSNLEIQEFLFSPSEGKLGLLARITRGTMAYLSGLIGKLAPESARFETPTATIGIRGTYFVVKVGEPDAKKGG
ncbi:MAG TPA: FecR domain-containing protein [Candidatus Krumholzibacterium sp.]|nr:FecR domain-containing protein [Candidatus Krumholzibacterium sp.]